MTLGEQKKLIDKLINLTYPSQDDLMKFYYEKYIYDIENLKKIENDEIKLMAMGWAMMDGALTCLWRACEIMDDDEDTPKQANYRFFRSVFKPEISYALEIEKPKKEKDICKMAAKACKKLYNAYEARAYSQDESKSTSISPLDSAAMAIAGILMELGYDGIGFDNKEFIESILSE